MAVPLGQFVLDGFKLTGATAGKIDRGQLQLPRQEEVEPITDMDQPIDPHRS